jgi:hypothetical protein
MAGSRPPVTNSGFGEVEAGAAPVDTDLPAWSDIRSCSLRRPGTLAPVSTDRSAGEDAALGWAREHLAGPVAVEPLKDRPWGRTWRLVSADGPVYLKAASPASGYEAALLPALTAVVPDQLPAVLATDPASGYLLLADAGPVLGLLSDDAEPTGVRDWEALLTGFAQLQRKVAPLADRLVDLGVPDERLDRVPDLLADLLAGSPNLAATAAEPALTAGERARLHALRPRWSAAAAELGALGLPASIQHGDLHPSNVTLGPDGRMRFIDFGDASVAHPFTTLFVPFGMAAQDGIAGAELDRLRNGYLEVFSDLAPMTELRPALDVGLRVARLLRVTSWDRALRAAPGDPDWGHRLLQSLRRLLEEEEPG